MDDLVGKLALVTGAGDGIGAMLARRFADVGLRVCVQDIRADAAEAVASAIGKSAFPLVFDVSDRNACLVAAQSLREMGAPLNVLWINAGVGVGAGLIDAKQNTIEWAFNVNVLGAIWSAQAFVPLMDNASGTRHVGITASSAALRSPDGAFPLYATTKHATFAVAEALRSELTTRDISATILCPGLLNSQIWDGAKARPERFGGVRRQEPAAGETWRRAKDPSLMWPHIEAAIKTGGGYLTCSTDDGDTAHALLHRTDEILAGVVEI